MRRLIASLLLCLPALLHADPWTRNMMDGSMVRIDPNTHVATHFSNGGTTQLWDGVHETQNGAVLIVKDGVVISGLADGGAAPAPDEKKKPEKDGEQVADVADPSCVSLVIKVCGFDGECNNSTACSPARQLLQLETEESFRGSADGVAELAHQCRDALANEHYFTACNAQPPAPKMTDCAGLVESVCGTSGACNDNPGCDPAKQLQEMETGERWANQRRPDRPIRTSQQCRKALDGDPFFAPCKP